MKQKCKIKFPAKTTTTETVAAAATTAAFHLCHHFYFHRGKKSKKLVKLRILDTCLTLGAIDRSGLQEVESSRDMNCKVHGDMSHIEI